MSASSPNERPHVQHTLKFTLVMSSNPSSKVGSRYREAKPVNAIFGSIVLDSGFIYRSCKSAMGPFLEYAGKGVAVFFARATAQHC